MHQQALKAQQVQAELKPGGDLHLLKERGPMLTLS